MEPILLRLDTRINNYASIDLMQGYNYTLEAHITDNYKDVDLTGVTVQLQMQKPDKKFIIQTENIIIEGNKIKATLDKDFTREDGQAKLQVVLFKDNFTFGSWVIKAKIKPSAINDNDGQSENKVTITETLINKISEAENTKIELDKSIASGDVATIKGNVDKIKDVEIPKINEQLETKTNKEYVNSLINNIKSATIKGSYPSIEEIPDIADKTSLYLISEGIFKNHFVYHNGTAWVDGGLFISNGFYNVDITSFTTDTYIGVDGAEGGGDGSYSSSDFIEIEFLNNYEVKTSGANITLSVAFYSSKSNSSFVSGIKNINEGEFTINTLAIDTIPQNAKYFKVCTKVIYKENSYVLSKTPIDEKVQEIDNRTNLTFVDTNKNLEQYNLSVSGTNIVIPNNQLKGGYLNITINAIESGNITFYILEKASSNFLVKYKKEFSVSLGINALELDYCAKSGQYLGFDKLVKLNTSSGTGMYEISKTDLYIGEYCSFTDNVATGFDFAINYSYKYLSNSELTVAVNKEKESNDINQSKINYDLLKYREITENYGFVGRWFTKEIEGKNYYCTINQGSEFYFKIKNTSYINLIFKEITSDVTPYFAYQIDGNSIVRQKITNPTINCSRDEHIVRVICDGLTESENKWNGEIGFAFEKAEIEIGGSIKGIYPRNRKGLFFGDSITEGIRSLNMDANSNGNSSYLAFPFVTCEKLNSVSIRVGFGASGICKVGSGEKCITVIDNMTANRETPYCEPDFIVINHGTNDYDIDSITWKDEFDKVLNRLRVKYSGVPIFTVIPFNQAHAQDIRDCVSDKKWYYLIETEGWGITYTDGLHPDKNGGIIGGLKLSEEIMNVLGENYFLV